MSGQRGGTSRQKKTDAGVLFAVMVAHGPSALRWPAYCCLQSAALVISSSRSVSEPCCPLALRSSEWCRAIPRSPLTLDSLEWRGAVLRSADAALSTAPTNVGALVESMLPSSASRCCCLPGSEGVRLEGCWSTAGMFHSHSFTGVGCEARSAEDTPAESREALLLKDARVCSICRPKMGRCAL